MKKLTLQSLAAVLLATTILFSSCTKEGTEAGAIQVQKETKEIKT